MNQFRDAEIWELAKKQHGVVAYWQLARLGVRQGGLRSRWLSGEWIRELRGVVRMAWAEEIWLQRIWAAWLWAGPVTAISHFAAGALNGLAVEMPSVVHVTIPYRFGPKSSKRWLVVRRLMKEPWLLASSLGEVAGPEIVRRYGRRFTIEESFRDIKDLRFGMGLSATRISKPARRDRLLLLSALSIALLTVLGAAGEAVGIDRHFKVNTSKRRQYSLFAQTLEVI